MEGEVRGALNGWLIDDGAASYESLELFGNVARWNPHIACVPMLYPARQSEVHRLDPVECLKISSVQILV